MGTAAPVEDRETKVKAPEMRDLLNRWGALKNERSSWWSHWQEITQYLLPRSGRYFVGDRNDGGRKHNAIYDNTGTRALRTLGAGLMAGATSPARPWFRLTTADPDLAEAHGVRQWLERVTRRMQTVFQRSNTYRSLHSMYEELGAFGTAATCVLPDYEDAVHLHNCTIGEYALATDYRGRVNAIYREFEVSVQELADEFGLENCSESVRRLHASGNLDAGVNIIHAIEPRADRDATQADARNMPWGSYYFEAGGDGEQFLRESGFRYFPTLAPRWSVTGNDVYGHSPGMEALGDVKQLQHEQLRKAQGIDYQTKPPLQAPLALKNRDMDILPGGISYVDDAQGQIRTAFEARLDLGVLLEDIRDVRDRVNGAFYADLFLLLANATDTRMTATEVAIRHEEKLLMLGPVLERLHHELLEPLIDITFQRMVEVGMVKDAPPELQGMELSVEFVSVLAQAQKAMGIASSERFVQGVTTLAQVQPEVLDNLDGDAWVRLHSDNLGADARLLRDPRAVAMIREQRARQVAEQQKREDAAAAADMAAKLAKAPAPSTQPSALSDLLGQYQGYASPTALEVAANAGP